MQQTELESQICYKRNNTALLVSAQSSRWIDFDDTDRLSTDVWVGSRGRIVKK